MDFLHCNGCGHNPQWCPGEALRNYLLTSCGHVFCQMCSQRIQDTCPVCRLNCRLVQVSSESKSEIKAFFMEPTDLFKENMKQFFQVMNFQKTQFRSFRNQTLNLLERTKVMRSENDRLKAGNFELAKRIDGLENREQSWIGNGVLRTVNSSPAHSETRFMKTIDPSFTKLFGAGSGSNLRLASPNAMVIPSPDSRNPTGVQANTGIRRSGGRISAIPFTHNLSRSDIDYSPLVSPIAGSSVRSTPGRPSFGQQQQQLPRKHPSSTPDIMSRLKTLRW